MATKRKFSIFGWLRNIVNRIFKGEAALYSFSNMEEAMEKWLAMYYDEPPWLKKTHGKSMNLPSSIASEFARLVMVEFDVTVSGSPRADFINTQFKRMTENLRIDLEKACSVGGMVFKPYVIGGIIMTDCVIQDEFVPLEFTKSMCTGGVFVSMQVRESRYYWQLEKQRYDFETRTHVSKSKFFVSDSPYEIGKEIDVGAFPFRVQADFTVYNCDKPLFAFWRVPLANTVEKNSPLGISVYSRAAKNIMEADKQWDRFLWEFEGGELAIDASEFALRTTPVSDSEGNTVRMEMPKTKERLFRRINARNKDNSAFYQVFAPTLRDNSFGNGLNKILRVIEWNCGLAYGTLSDPQNVDKTAEEIKSSKQRSYTFVDNMQQSLQATLEQYIYAINKYASACNLTPEGDYEVAWNWGDGILEDVDKETQTRMQEVNNNIVKPEYYLKWRYGVDDKKAEKMLPSQDGYKNFFE